MGFVWGDLGLIDLSTLKIISLANKMTINTIGLKEKQPFTNGCYT